MTMPSFSIDFVSCVIFERSGLTKTFMLGNES
jgi:hypothetical protein